jgi:CMP-N-acetylneuraminic acid synthetase
VPFIRPAKLASDTSPEWLSWQHALNYLKKTEHSLPDVMLILPATAPLRLPEDIKQCLDIFEQEKVDVVITVTEAHRNPYFNMVSKQEDGSFNLVISPANNISRRQAAPVVYDMTTVAYVVNPQFVLRESSIFAGRVKAVSVPVERAIDIDTKLDFDIAEWLLARNVRRK